ncbi:hypothetical protein Pint_30157 [Pistacia integerrima]|uniref:Uncharacterized protein n=1 Tax=Pistacia integerrima TaxID=434235 RepID=A0ACC0X1S1_9ROSI|nr:hypothetical protein Pint_30157 [Pistacia integerrima]
MQCRWSASRLEFAVDVILNVALENKKFGNGGSSGMSRKKAREEARKQIGDTSLLDHISKYMNNIIVDDHIVYHAMNPSVEIMEPNSIQIRVGLGHGFS